MESPRDELVGRQLAHAEPSVNGDVEAEGGSASSSQVAAYIESAEKPAQDHALIQRAVEYGQEASVTATAVRLCTEPEAVPDGNCAAERGVCEGAGSTTGITRERRVKEYIGQWWRQRND